MNAGQFFHFGNLCEFTGHTETVPAVGDVPAAMLYEFRYLEGPKIGTTGVTFLAPDEMGATS